MRSYLLIDYHRAAIVGNISAVDPLAACRAADAPLAIAHIEYVIHWPKYNPPDHIPAYLVVDGQSGIAVAVVTRHFAKKLGRELLL
jgi:hypothetical protein